MRSARYRKQRRKYLSILSVLHQQWRLQCSRQKQRDFQFSLSCIVNLSECRKLLEEPEPFNSFWVASRCKRHGKRHGDRGLSILSELHLEPSSVNNTNTNTNLLSILSELHRKWNEQKGEITLNPAFNSFWVASRYWAENPCSGSKWLSILSELHPFMSTILICIRLGLSILSELHLRWLYSEEVEIISLSILSELHQR